jgi:N-acetylmuramoyl-L-alanine amidase
MPGLLLAGATLLVPVAGARTAEQAPASAPARRVWTVLTTSGTQPLPVTVVNGREYVSGADLSGLFGLVLKEDRAGGLVLTMGARTIVVSLTQGLASVDGRVVSLPAPPTRQGTTWLLPVEVIERALAPGSSPRIDVRRRSSLVVVGSLSVPAVTVRNEPLPTGTRLTFTITPAVPQTLVNENGRLLVRLAADALDADLTGLTPGALLAGARVVPPSTLELGLGPQFGSYRATEQREGATLRLTVDVVAATPGPAAPSPTTDQPAPAAPGEVQNEPGPALLPEATGLRTIVIDPGHGGTENGARGPTGTLEKNVVLSMARQLKAAIEARLGIRVLLTRSGDETVALDSRAAFANNNKADLFISIHANASVRSSVTGAEVFYVTLGEYGTARASAAEPGALLPTFGGGERSVDLILWEMAQAQHLNESARFARLVETEMRQRVPMSPRAIQQAPFRVLVGANMPAVLVETGFITNPTEEKRLNTPDYQAQLVNAMLAAVVRFKATSERVGTAQAPTQPSQDPR